MPGLAQPPPDPASQSEQSTRRSEEAAMDALAAIFEGRPQQDLRAALERTGGNVDVAIELLLDGAADILRLAEGNGKLNDRQAALLPNRIATPPPVAEQIPPSRRPSSRSQKTKEGRNGLQSPLSSPDEPQMSKLEDEDDLSSEPELVPVPKRRRKPGTRKHGPGPVNHPQASPSVNPAKKGNYDMEEDDVELLDQKPAVVHEPLPKSAAPEIPNERDVVTAILGIFADACPRQITTLFHEHSVAQRNNIINFIATFFLENGYNRAEIVGKKRKRRMSDAEEQEKEKEFDWDAPGRSGATKAYRAICQKLLEQEFPRVPSLYVRSVLRASGFLSPAYQRLAADERNYNTEGPYQHLVSVRKIVDQESLMSTVEWEWDLVIAELDFAREKTRRLQLEAQFQKDEKLAEDLDTKEHQDSHNMFECQCCFGDYPFRQMTHCNAEAMHFFCLECATTNAKTEIGKGQHKLVCMDSSGCKEEFPRAEVLRFLDEKTIYALAKLQQEEELRMAEIEGLVHCPFCDYAAIYDPINEANKWFECQNPGCRKTSCRQCQRNDHRPKTCEEAVKDEKVDKRHVLEEAMTQAMVRRCKKCANPYIKESGCNKIQCTKCRTLQWYIGPHPTTGIYDMFGPRCMFVDFEAHSLADPEEGVNRSYVCSAVIADYRHFDDTGRGGKQGQCPLFDNTEERHEDEIEAARRIALEKLRVEHPELDDADLEIKLSDEAKKIEERRRAAHARGPGVPGRLWAQPPGLVPGFGPVRPPPPPPPPQPLQPGRPDQPVPFHRVGRLGPPIPIWQENVPPMPLAPLAPPPHPLYVPYVPPPPQPSFGYFPPLGAPQQAGAFFAPNPPFFNAPNPGPGPARRPEDLVFPQPIIQPLAPRPQPVDALPQRQRFMYQAARARGAGVQGGWRGGEQPQ